MKSLIHLFRIFLVLIIAITFIRCSSDDQKSIKSSDPPMVAEQEEETYIPPKQKFTNTIVLIVDTDSLLPPSDMTQEEYIKFCRFENQKKKQTVKTFETKIRKKARVIWAGEPSNEASEDIVDIVEIALLNQNDSANVLQQTPVMGDSNGLAVGKVRKGEGRYEQSYSLTFRVNDSTYTFDPKLRVLK